MVSVACLRDAGDWLVEVRDNGQGVSAGRIGQIQEELGESLAERDTALFERDFSKGKLGLLGTVARLRLMYGQAARFDIESPESGGTLIRLGGPFNHV